jgi:plastocyanin
MKAIQPLQRSLSRAACLAGAAFAWTFWSSAAVVNVSVVNNAFTPASVSMNIDDQVTWKWAASDGGIPHSTTSNGGLWDSGIRTEPFSFSHTFASAGTFPYHCTVHAGLGMVGTVKVQGAVVNQPPVITTQPASQTVSAGMNVVFTVAATGTPPLSYQWSKDGTAVPGASKSSLKLTAVTANNAGSYSVVVSGPGGSTPSGDAQLTVQPSNSSAFVPGTYSGLFFVPNAVEQSSSGTVSLRNTAQGKFSGVLQSGRNRFPLTGQFDAAGAVSRTISRKGANPMTVVLQLDPNDGDRMSGSVSDGVFTAPLAANRAVFDGRQQAAPEAGLYTLSIAGSDDSSLAPGGSSVGTVRVDKAGKIRLAGSLADGTPISQSSVVSKSGDWPFYIALYGGQGSMLGWLSFTGATPEDIGGSVAWIKPGIPKARFYPAGFLLNTTAAGFAYNPPAAGTAILTSSNVVLRLHGGNLTQDMSEQMRLGPRNQVTDVNGRKLNVTFVPSTGTFRGRVTNPDTQKPVSFNGVVLEGLNLATGYFLGTNQTGKVTLAP